ncbi:HAD family hydrolase [Mongoliitalea daihaiensis]|uniref:HAD family hydrolase n=1 Tax=Mongoliitalea daihaiensis TaxID=2782006 RepID=UPI001F3481FF|nr:HAD family phosphatase [Mongoliitalea daihaiensis]UJP65094.1 HAD family phosphatase [Mongoliitalea daihaiensis]
MSKSFEAILFDLNGTIIDDMAYHAKAWHDLLVQDLQVDITIERVWLEMYGKNSELFARVLGPDALTEEEMHHWSIKKEKRYQEVYKELIAPIEGFQSFMELLQGKNYKIALGTAAIPFNVDFSLDALGIRSFFDAIVHADDVVLSKPNPEVFLKCASAVGVAPEKCVVFEDSPKGVEAARKAGMQAVVLTTMHPKEDFAYLDNILFFIQDYRDESLNLFK